MRLNYYILLLLLIACTSLPTEKKPNSPNPISYVFHTSKENLRNQLILEVDRFREMHLILHYRESGGEPLDTLEIFDHPSNRGDFYLEQEDFFIFKSHIYFVEGSAAEYQFGLHLHLDEVSNGLTRVTVETIKPRIVIGKQILPSPPHFVRQLRYKYVMPSTIEEYEILRQIGELLNEQGMPSVRYPD